MMISRNEATGALRAYVGEAQGPGRPAPTAPAKDGTEGVTLSSQAVDVSRWLAQLRSIPDVRPERVADVKQRLQAGDYPPPGGAVAEKMLSRWLANQ